MSRKDLYPNIDDPKFLQKFYKNKEFIINKIPLDVDDIDEDIILDDRIEVILKDDYNAHSYQKLAKYVMSPNTPYTRLLLKYNTGAGKTRTALDIAMEFIKLYRTEYVMGINNKKVYIMGFTSEQFKDELLKYPEFGFVSAADIVELNRVKNKANADTASIQEKENFIRLKRDFRRRLTNDKIGGFFRFYGYKQFVNILYTYIEKDITADVDKISKGKNEDFISGLSEDDIIRMLKSGELKLNEDIVKLFEGSLLICDEIHEVYNKVDNNSWGIALQTILDYHKDRLKALFLSATPLNNSPTEIIKVINLLNAHDKIKESDLFLSNAAGTNGSSTYTFVANYESILEEKLRGRIAFVNNIDPEYYPKLIYEGEKISGIDYLKFRICKMSKFQKSVYDSIESFNFENHYVLDVAFPPILKDGSEVGLKTNEEFKSIARAPDAWKKKYGLDYEAEQVVSGSGLGYDKIGEYSSKYYEMLKWFNEIIKPTKWDDETRSSGKIFIYHKYVQASGVKFIVSIMRENGYIGRMEPPTPDTKCSICNVQKKIHSAGHSFSPARFVYVHSKMSEVETGMSIDIYNSPNNSDGSIIKFLIGSATIGQSKDFKAIRYMAVMFYPDDVSKLIQLIGRGNRTNSHIGMPEDLREVRVNIFVSSLSEAGSGYEVDKYRDKIKSYKLIQKIEKVMHECSIDNKINAEMNKQSIDETKLGPLNYDVHTFKATDIVDTTFKIFRTQEEVDYCILLIKRLFIGVSRVWTFEKLWEAVTDPPFHEKVDNSLINKDNFICALDKLYYSEIDYIDVHSKIYTKLREERDDLTNVDIQAYLHNSNDKFIILPNNSVNTIIKRGDYYICVPIQEGSIIKILDQIEAPYRNLTISDNINVDILSYMNTRDPLEYYERKKSRFMAKYSGTDLNHISKAFCEYNTEFHIFFVEECISFIQWLLIGAGEDHGPVANKEFYFKMLYYYDLLDLILFVDTIDSQKREQFKKYTLPSTRGKDCEPCKQQRQGDSRKKDEFDNLINMLESSIENSSCTWCPNANQKKFLESVKLVANTLTEVKVNKKVAENILPVGHRIGKMTRILHPEKGWYSVPHGEAHERDKNINKKYVENDIIIGYDEQSKTGILKRFKIRTPIHKKVEHTDLRLVERGAICSYKNKEIILNLIKKLDGDIGKILEKKPRIEELCEELRSILLLKELNERKKGSNIKYFYYYFEV